MKKMLDIGFRNYIPIDKIVAILDLESAPIKRLIKNSKDEMLLIDATFGRRTLSVIILESNHVVVSSINRKTLAKRIDELCV